MLVLYLPLLWACVHTEHGYSTQMFGKGINVFFTDLAALLDCPLILFTSKKNLTFRRLCKLVSVHVFLPITIRLSTSGRKTSMEIYFLDCLLRRKKSRSANNFRLAFSFILNQDTTVVSFDAFSDNALIIIDKSQILCSRSSTCLVPFMTNFYKWPLHSQLLLL